jgi:hypothetical protein
VGVLGEKASVCCKHIATGNMIRIWIIMHAILIVFKHARFI